LQELQDVRHLTNYQHTTFHTPT